MGVGISEQFIENARLTYLLLCLICALTHESGKLTGEECRD